MRLRSVSADFHVTAPATCLDCGDPTCASTTRTVSVALHQDGGTPGEPLQITRTGGYNLSAVAHTPNGFTSLLGQDLTIESTGTLSTCAPFAYWFDITAPDCAGPGGFTETRDLTAELLSGTFGAAATIPLVDETLTLCPGTYHARLEASGTVVVEGNGATLDTGNTQVLVAVGGASLTVRDLTVGTGAGPGSGLYCDGSTVVFEDSTLTGHDGVGGALYAVDCDVSLVRTDVIGNRAPGGGGGMRVEATTLVLEDSTVAGNTAAGFGGGIELVDSTGIFTGSTIAANVANDGKQLMLNGATTTVDLLDCDLGSGFTFANYDIATNDGVRVRHFEAELVSDASCASGICGREYIVAAPASGPTQLFSGGWITHSMNPGDPAPAYTLDAFSTALRTTDPMTSCSVEPFVAAPNLFGGLSKILTAPVVTIGPVLSVVRFDDVDAVLPVDTFGGAITWGYDISGCGVDVELIHPFEARFYVVD
ncbi:MAG: hypothetical protein H6737_21535 [Alphaproteobacteria bacterium]|nr:hypothetical protein [Alphaproteobacteria bacterium]